MSSIIKANPNLDKIVTDYITEHPISDDDVSDFYRSVSNYQIPTMYMKYELLKRKDLKVGSFAEVSSNGCGYDTNSLYKLDENTIVAVNSGIDSEIYSIKCINTESFEKYIDMLFDQHFQIDITSSDYTDEKKKLEDSIDRNCFYDSIEQ
jgi:hypothetical protein